MNNATLQAFRDIADTMADGPTDWQWIGPHMSQRGHVQMSQHMFGITQQRAEDYAQRHGGTASKMEAAR